MVSTIPGHIDVLLSDTPVERSDLNGIYAHALLPLLAQAGPGGRVWAQYPDQDGGGFGAVVGLNWDDMGEPDGSWSFVQFQTHGHLHALRALTLMVVVADAPDPDPLYGPHVASCVSLLDEQGEHSCLIQDVRRTPGGDLVLVLAPL